MRHSSVGWHVFLKWPLDLDNPSRDILAKDVRNRVRRTSDAQAHTLVILHIVRQHREGKTHVHGGRSSGTGQQDNWLSL